MFKNKKLKTILTKIKIMEHLTGEDGVDGEFSEEDNCNKCGKTNKNAISLNLMYNNLEKEIQQVRGKIGVLGESVDLNKDKIEHVQGEVDAAHKKYQDAKAGHKR